MLDELPGGYLVYEAFVNAAKEYHAKDMRRQLQALARFHASPTVPLDDEERHRLARLSGGTVRKGSHFNRAVFAG